MGNTNTQHAERRTERIAMLSPVSTPRGTDEKEGSVSGSSEALAKNISRIQNEEAQRIEREEQERVALIREKARLD